MGRNRERGDERESSRVLECEAISSTPITDGEWVPEENPES